MGGLIPIPDWKVHSNHIADVIEGKNPKNFNRNKFVKWYNEKEYMGIKPFDATLIYKCYEVYKKLLDDYDNWWVVAGKEGFGKSTIAINCACMISQNFDNKFILLRAEQFNEGFKNANVGDTILMDEGGALLFSRDAMSARTKFIIKAAMVARAKNVNLIVVVPNFYLIDTYIRDHRVDLLLQVKSRGDYRGIIGLGLTKASSDGWKYKNVMNVRMPTTTFWDGNFSKEVSHNFDWDLYKKNKMAYIKEFLSGKEGDVNNNLVSLVSLSKETDISPKTLAKWANLGKVNAKKIGAKWYILRSDFEKMMDVGNKKNVIGRGVSDTPFTDE